MQRAWGDMDLIIIGFLLPETNSKHKKSTYPLQKFEHVVVGGSPYLLVKRLLVSTDASVTGETGNR